MLGMLFSGNRLASASSHVGGKGRSLSPPKVALTVPRPPFWKCASPPPQHPYGVLTPSSCFDRLPSASPPPYLHVVKRLFYPTRYLSPIAMQNHLSQ